MFEDRYHGRWSVFSSKPDNGWIPWDGGKFPVEAGIDIDVRHRSGRMIFFRPPCSIAGNWIHDGSSKDIVAYRIHEKDASLLNLDQGEVPF